MGGSMVSLKELHQAEQNFLNSGHSDTEIRHKHIHLQIQVSIFSSHAISSTQETQLAMGRWLGKLETTGN